jgi:hypothetical protein
LQLQLLPAMAPGKTAEPIVIGVTAEPIVIGVTLNLLSLM